MPPKEDVAAWVSSLKVNDLKEELKKLGLPTTGLKAVLAERLLGALQSKVRGLEWISCSRIRNVVVVLYAAAKHRSIDQGSTCRFAQENENGKDSMDTDQNGSDEQKQEPGSNEEPSSADAKPEVSQEVAPEAQAKADAMSQDRNDERQHAVTHSGKAQHADEPAASKQQPTSEKKEDLTVHSILDPDAEPVDYGEGDDAEPSADAPEPSEPASNERQSSEPAEPMDARAEGSMPDADDSEMPGDQQASEQAGAKDTSGKRKRDPIPLYSPRERKSQGAQDLEKPKSDGTPATADKQAAAEGPSSSTDRPAKIARTSSAKNATADASATHAAAEPQHAGEAPSSAVPATAALRVDNLVRPFTENQLRQLLGQTGTIKDMWMPSIKTHCFVIFTSEEEAEATRQALHNLKWPRDSPKLLNPYFISMEDAEKAILEGKDPKAAAAANAGAVAAIKRQLQQRQQQQLEHAVAAAAADATTRRPSQQLETASSAGAAEEPSKARSAGDAQPAEEAEPVKTLDELFRKTTTKPALYWLPLTDEEVREQSLLSMCTLHCKCLLHLDGHSGQPRRFVCASNAIV